MPQTRIARIERLVGPPPERRTLRYFIRAGTRRSPWVWFDPGQVPAFEGEHAWFECERIKGGWRVLRQVETPAWAR